MKKLLKWFLNFWKMIWEVVKSMSNWKGIISLILVWFIISGSGIFLVGFVFKNSYLMWLGGAIYIVWLTPIPLIPINIAIALLVQRFVFQDKTISWKVIKEKFKQIWSKDDDEKKEVFRRV